MTHDTSERKLTHLPQITLSARPVCVFVNDGRSIDLSGDIQQEVNQMVSTAVSKSASYFLAKIREFLP